MLFLSIWIQLDTGRYVYIFQPASDCERLVYLHIDGCLVVCTVTETDLIRRKSCCVCLRLFNICD